MWGHVSLVSVLSHQNVLCCGLTPKENESLALQGIQFAWHNLAPYNKRAKKFWFSWNVRLRFTTNLNAPYGLFKITRVLSINHTVSTILHCWYLILLTPNIRHVSKCSSPNSPLITFSEHTDVWGVCRTYVSWGCHVYSVLSVWYGLGLTRALYCTYCMCFLWASIFDLFTEIQQKNKWSLPFLKFPPLLRV